MSAVMDEDMKRDRGVQGCAGPGDLQGKTTVTEASQALDLPPLEIEQWMKEGKRGMEHALWSNPLDIRQEYERQLKEFQEAYGESMLELRAREIAVPAGRRRK